MEVSPRSFMYLNSMFFCQNRTTPLYARSRSGCPTAFDVELIVICQRFQHLEIIEVRRSQPRIAPPASDSSGFWIIDQDRNIAVRQGRRRSGRPPRVVKRKQSRLQFTHTVAANWQAKLAENSSSSAFGSSISAIPRYHRKAPARFQMTRQDVGKIVTHLEAINHHFNGMFLLHSSFGGSERSQTSPSIRARMCPGLPGSPAFWCVRLCAL